LCQDRQNTVEKIYIIDIYIIVNGDKLMITKYGKIGVFLFLSLLIGGNFVSISQGSSFQNNFSAEDANEHTAHSYSTGGILLPESEIPNNLPAGLNEPPVSWDWRDASINGKHGNWMTSIKNQGKCGSCWAFAAIATLEGMLNIRMNDPDFDFDLSEQHLVSCCTHYCNGCRGGSTYHAWLYLQKNGGAILESSFPYEAVDSNGCQLHGDCDKDPVLCSDKKDDWDYQQIPIDKDIGALSEPDRSTIQSIIVDHGPVAAYITVYSDLLDYSGGIYKHRNGEMVGGHIVSLIGYNDTEEYWIAENSWGKFWGEYGYFRIAYGECSIEKQIYFVDIDKEMLNFPPTANCGGVYQGTVGGPIDFHSDKSIDLENNIVSYNWNFGDGNTSNENNPSHSYSEKGMYRVTLTVTDEHGKTDSDEGAVFVDIWDIGNYWEYNISFETDEQVLYPILLPGSGSITNLILEVTDEDEQSYFLDFKGDLEAKLALNLDRKNTIFDLRLWSKLNYGTVSGSLIISKAGFGIEQYSLRVRGFGQLLILPIVPIPLWLPVPIDITIEKTYDEPKTLMGKIFEINEQWEIPFSNSSMELTFSVLFGMLSKTFNAQNFTDDEYTYICSDVTNVNTPAGSYQAYQLSSVTSYRYIDLYYSPAVKNVVAFNAGGGNSEILLYSGELISTNADE